MGDFVFYFASQAYYWEYFKKFPIKGVEDYGNLAHEFDIPVTWLTNTEGAKIGKEIFTQFHEEFGDEVIVWALPSTAKRTTSAKRDFALSLNEEQIKDYLKKEQEGVRKYLPWAKVDHIGYFYRTPAAVRAMKSLGIKSCYGHCWEEIATDGVTDNGAPWGFYYLDTDLVWKRPAQTAENSMIIANEWLQHDLNKCWNYYGSSSVFSWDPNDVGRANICDGREITYWKEGFKEYYRNRLWNKFIPFVFHQEAHEQESYNEGFQFYPPETIKNTYEMTKAFLEFITNGDFPDMKIMTLPQAVERYRTLNPITEPTYMLFRDIPITYHKWLSIKKETWELYKEAKEAEEEEGESLDPIKDYHKFKYLNLHYGWQGCVFEDKAPFPESLVVVDKNAQYFFHKDKVTPIKMWNYHKPIDPNFKNLYYNENLFREYELPKIILNNKYENGRKYLDIQILPKIERKMPFAIALWGDFSDFNLEINGSIIDTIAKNEVISLIKNIDNQVLFLELWLNGKPLKLQINKN